MCRFKCFKIVQFFFGKNELFQLRKLFGSFISNENYLAKVTVL